jgi:hypothetical protein
MLPPVKRLGHWSFFEGPYPTSQVVSHYLGNILPETLVLLAPHALNLARVGTACWASACLDLFLGLLPLNRLDPAGKARGEVALVS